jgi:pantetheine-phosphate adenylyltransferase
MEQIDSKIVVRGLRAISDFEYEFQMSCVNSRLNNNIETVFLPAKDDMHFVSSRMIKSVAELEGDISQFVPKCIVEIMKEFYRKS